jgi:hypothetical protein
MRKPPCVLVEAGAPVPGRWREVMLSQDLKESRAALRQRHLFPGSARLDTACPAFWQQQRLAVQ